MTFKLAVIQGNVDLDHEVREAACALASDLYGHFEEQEFSGDEVEDVLLPAWLDDWRNWFPLESLAALGLSPVEGRLRMYATASASPHIDDMDGLAAILVLFNDGLTFRQGKVRHRTAPGEWFILDDRLLHEVKEAKDSTVYLCLSLPLQAISP